MSVRLIVADDDPMALELIELILQRDDRFTLAGVASDGTQAVRAVQEHRPDALLLDVHMPGDSTETVISSVRVVAPDTRILLLSAVHEDQAAELCRLYGADGFLPKGLTSAILLDQLAQTLTA
jgi:DNA-binding NarL/FixJ family response regulator